MNDGNTTLSCKIQMFNNLEIIAKIIFQATSLSGLRQSLSHAEEEIRKRQTEMESLRRQLATPHPSEQLLTNLQDRLLSMARVQLQALTVIARNRCKAFFTGSYYSSFLILFDSISGIWVFISKNSECEMDKTLFFILMEICFSNFELYWIFRKMIGSSPTLSKTRVEFDSSY